MKSVGRVPRVHKIYGKAKNQLRKQKLKEAGNRTLIQEPLGTVWLECAKAWTRVVIGRGQAEGFQ